MTLSIKRQAFLSLLFEKKYKIFISKPLILICSIEMVGKILLSHPVFLLTRKQIRKRLCVPPLKSMHYFSFKVNMLMI